MSEETAHPHVKRRPAWHPASIAGALSVGRRPGDKTVRTTAKRVTTLGIIAAVVHQLLAMVGGVLAEQRQALRALPTAVAQAIREANADRHEDSAELVAQVKELREETAQHQAADAVEFAQLRGVVAGRLRCPPCPTCPTCPPVSLGVPKDSAPAWHQRER